MMVVGLVLAGAVVGLGVALLIREAVPAPPDLVSTLARLQIPPPADGSMDGAGGRSRVQDVLGGWVRRRLDRSGLPMPSRDLDLLGRSVEAHLAGKLTLAIAGLVLGPLTATVVVVAGVGVPVTIPIGASGGLAVLLFLLPDVDVRRRAAAARLEFRRGLCTYIDLVALERLADASAIEALERAARVGQGWVFDRIRDTLTRARLAGASPWQALSGLAAEVGVTELGDVGDIVAVSGEDGAAVHDTLRAHAQALRTALLTESETAANAASERLAIPVACLGLLFVAALTYPAIARILAT